MKLLIQNVKGLKILTFLHLEFIPYRNSAIDLTPKTGYKIDSFC